MNAALTGGKPAARFDENWNTDMTQTATTATAAFHRPADWPTGHLHDNGIVCPRCRDHYNVHVQVTATVRLTEAGSDDVGDHEYTGASAAECRTCGHSGPVIDFHALPPEQQVFTLTAVSCEWSTDCDVDPGAAFWAGLTCKQTHKAHRIAHRYWPGIQIVIDDQCLTLLTTEALTDPLNQELSDLLGSPDSII